MVSIPTSRGTSENSHSENREISLCTLRFRKGQRGGGVEAIWREQRGLNVEASMAELKEKGGISRRDDVSLNLPRS